jgi:hypothetical protein
MAVDTCFCTWVSFHRYDPLTNAVADASDEVEEDKTTLQQGGELHTSHVAQHPEDAY